MKCNKKNKYCDFYYSSDGFKDECLLNKCEDDYIQPKMKAKEECLKCPWKCDVGNKLVCMFRWCVLEKFKKGDSNGKT